MKEVKKTFYECEICGAEYATKAGAKECESKPKSQDKGVKLGDIVLITDGQSVGKKAVVTKIWVYDKDWGHYAWERYWHTVGLCADIIGSSASRQLTWDGYEVVK